MNGEVYDFYSLLHSALLNKCIVKERLDNDGFNCI